MNNIDNKTIGIITEVPSPAPLSYYINSPRLEQLLGSNFEKVSRRYGLKELLCFTANSYWSANGGINDLKFSPNPERRAIMGEINGLTDPEKLQLIKAIIQHIETNESQKSHD